MTDSAPEPGAPIRLVIADDHPVVRAGLFGVLSAEPDLDIVGEAASGEDAVRLALDLRPDVVLMDLVMPPGISGIDATAQISSVAPEVRVLVLTTYDAADDVVRAIEAGAAGYLLKDIPRAELAAAIRTTAAGATALAQPAAQALLRRTRSPDVRPVLSPREVQVLELVARGMSNSDVAEELFITEATVKTHLVRTFAKLGVEDRTAAVVAAIRQGLLAH